MWPGVYVASFPGSSLLPRNNFTYDDRAGQRSYVKLLRGRREEPGNEASPVLFLLWKVIFCVVRLIDYEYDVSRLSYPMIYASR